MLAVVSCVQKPRVSVNADFTTDKEVYEIYEDVKITNTSTSTTASARYFCINFIFIIIII